MSVLKGEGRVPILFGTTSVPAGPLTRTAYLARPDLAGEWPTIVMVSSVWGLTSSIKDIARRLSRQGFAVLAPDLYDGEPPPRSAPFEQAADAFSALGPGWVRAVLSDVAGFITNPSGFWSNAASGFGLLGFGSGGLHAAHALVDGMGEALSLVGSPLVERDGEPGLAALAPAIARPLLALYGREDEGAPVEDVLALRAVAPHGEFVLYDGVGSDFFDDYSEGYDAAAAADAIERLAGFFEKQLPAAPD